MNYTMRWTERTFTFGLPLGLFPCVLERLRGTPARIEDRIRQFPPSILTTRVNEGWSIQEHAGHLYDLGELDDKRLMDYLAGAEVLSPADMQNRKTHEANHNAQRVEEILKQFRESREGLIKKLERFDETQVAITSLHPRLKMPMRVIDWCYFMAEHDDHHVARMTELARILRSSS